MVAFIELNIVEQKFDLLLSSATITLIWRFFVGMKVDSRYSRSFYSDGLSDTKYREIHALALSIQEVKNEISEIVNQNLFHYLEMSKYQFQTEMLPLVKNRISSHFVKQLLDDVYVAYQNKFKNIKTRLKFQHIKEYSFTYYKRSGKTKSGRVYRAEDFKGISIKHDETPLSITLTYLARYGYFGIVDYLLEKFVNDGIAVSLVQSFYTSQTCPKCGCIDKENRKDQEHFECIECGYKANADLNASRNIKQRVVSTVLRDELLKKNSINSSAYVPDVNSKEKTKEALELFRNSLICV